MRFSSLLFYVPTLNLSITNKFQAFTFYSRLQKKTLGVPNIVSENIGFASIERKKLSTTFCSKDIDIPMPIDPGKCFEL